MPPLTESTMYMSSQGARSSTETEADDEVTACDIKSIKGRAKNVRNQLDGILKQARKDEPPCEDGVEYALDELKTCIEQVDELGDAVCDDY